MIKQANAAVGAILVIALVPSVIKIWANTRFAPTFPSEKIPKENLLFRRKVSKEFSMEETL
ncbi:MAG: hypothetical protein GQ578_00495 [Desulfuromonadaceae bacterium]|nr:hypothetical protein [Desulfuromonadaceae bacterium]